jgi:hypothetical protein
LIGIGSRVLSLYARTRPVQAYVRPYQTPRFHYGDVVKCEMRGDVKIVCLTAARIPWPKCRTGKRSRAIIL